ncbi:hypothetical protein ASG35_24230 [Burkholderia sp. Leaf177]|nr:hypothetical protein ASG35_24230 [Burkholderia sp. Leaf177]
MPNYEYDLYKTATKQYPDCASAGYELLRFGRVVGPDKDRLPADKSANWQSVSFAAQQSGYINLSDARVCKLSDADFPWFMGWTKVSEGAGALSDDGLCDSKVILDLLQEANGVDVPKAGASLDRLALYLRDHEEVRQKLRGLICEAPTEWDRSTNHKRFDRLTQAGEHYEGNPEGLDEFLQFVEKFQFWDTTGLPTKVWHFHPLKFIECIKKCSWLSQRETIQLLPVSAMRPHKGAFVSEKVVVDQSIIDQFRPDLNRALRKYGIVTADRMAAFFGNAMQEIQWFGKLYENASSQWYYPWDGRGLLQLTGPGNYIKYWRWRGRDIAKDVESALVEAYNKKDHAALQDAKNVGVTTMMKQWRDDIAGILTSTTYERSDSAGAYWAWTEASRFADRPSKMERAGKLVEGGRGIYYKNQSFGQVAATVNFGSPVSNIASVERVNGIVARYQGFTNALVVLADTPQFPDGAGRLLSIPESFERRK